MYEEHGRPAAHRIVAEVLEPIGMEMWIRSRAWRIAAPLGVLFLFLGLYLAAGYSYVNRHSRVWEEYLYALAVKERVLTDIHRLRPGVAVGHTAEEGHGVLCVYGLRDARDQRRVLGLVRAAMRDLLPRRYAMRVKFFDRDVLPFMSYEIPPLSTTKQTPVTV